MTTDAPIPREHELVGLVREDEHEWVIRTRLAGRDALTRVFRAPAEGEGVESALAAAALGGPALGEDLPWALRRVVDGYRLRATLPLDLPLAAVLDAGLADGRPYVTRAWIGGESLNRAWPRLTVGERDDALVQILALLERLHAEGVVYQDLKPDNVVRDEAGRAWIVDLESFRRTDALGWVAWTHLSPAYAAPEQLRGVSCAASDIYAFGKVLQALGVQTSPSWKAIAEACLQYEPSLRPSAAAARQWAHGAPPLAEYTIRVPEPSVVPPDLPALVPVPAPPALPGLFGRDSLPPEVSSVPAVIAAPPPPEAARPPERARRGAVPGIGAVVLLVLLIAAFLGAAQEEARRRDEARAALRAQAAELAERGAEALEQHKVSAAHNNDGDLAAALVLLRQAAALDPSNADARGWLALGVVWSQRWHWDDAQWDAARWESAHQVVEGALSAGRTRPGEVAAGLLDAASCRLSPAARASRDQTCSTAADRLERAARNADWLGAEALWGAIVVYRDLSLRAYRAKDPTEASALASQGLRRCVRGEGLLRSAPVNNLEIVRDCVILSGLSGESDAWERWAKRFTDMAKERYGTVRKREVAHLVSTPRFECAAVPLRDDGWPRDVDEWSEWCREMAERPLGCSLASPGVVPKWCPPTRGGFRWLFGL